MKYIWKCTVCGQIFDADKTDFDCPYCGWMNCFDCSFDDERDSANGMTREEAKKRFRCGLDKRGNPLPKVRPKDAEGEPLNANEGNA